MNRFTVFVMGATSGACFALDITLLALSPPEHAYFGIFFGTLIIGFVSALACGVACGGDSVTTEEAKVSTEQSA